MMGNCQQGITAGTKHAGLEEAFAMESTYRQLDQQPPNTMR